MGSRRVRTHGGVLATAALVAATVATTVITLTSVQSVSAASFAQAPPERLYMSPAGTTGVPALVPIGTLPFIGQDLISGDDREIIVDVADGSPTEPTCLIESPAYYYFNCSRVQLTASFGKISVGSAVPRLQNDDPAFPVYELAGGAFITMITPAPSGPSSIIHMNGTAAQLNLALANLVFTPDNGYIDTGAPRANLEILLSSADGTTFTHDVEIVVRGLNDFPTLTGPAVRSAEPEIELVVSDAYDVADTDNDEPTDGPGDKMLLIAIMSCGSPIAVTPPESHGFYLQGGQFTSDKDDLQELLATFFGPEQAAVTDKIIEGITALPGGADLLTVPLATSNASTYKTAFAGIGTLSAVQYALDKVTFLHDVPDDTCEFLTVVSDLGNNGLPLQYIGSSPDGVEVPIPGFALSTLTINMGKLKTIDASFEGGDVVVEGGTARVNIKITPAIHPAFTLHVQTNAGTATTEDDYNEMVDVLFSVGENVETIEVTTSIETDSEPPVEGDETFAFELLLPTDIPERPVGWEVTSTMKTAPVTIVDEDDGLNPLSVSIEAATSINEGDTGPVTITVSPATHPALTVTVSTGGGDAVAGTDYVELNAVDVIIPANVATVDVDLSTIDNLLDEPDKTFNVTMTPPDEPAGFELTMGTTETEVTITDNDNPVLLAVTLPSTLSIAEGAVDPITISISPATHPAFDVTVVTADVGATSPIDYTPISTTVNIPANATSVLVPLMTMGDFEVELAPETFTFTLTNPAAPEGFEFSSPTASSTVTITDDDSDPTALTISVPPTVNIAEGAVGPVAISISPAAHPPFDVTIATADGTAGALDYTAIPMQVLTIPANATSVPVALTTLQDLLVEGPQTFSLLVSPVAPPLGFTVTPPIVTSTITIDDDDIAPTAITISVPPTASISEGDVGPVAVTISPATHPAFNVTVTTTNGSAVAPGDYTALTSQTILIPANATTVNVNLTTIENAIDAADKNLTLTVSAPVVPPAGFTVAPSSVVSTVTITDDDDPVVDTSQPTVTVEQAVGQADPTTTSPINFTVAFSEDVTGFDDNADLSFTGSTVGGALMGTITGGPMTYNVAVTGMMTSSGVVVVNVPAAVASDTSPNANLNQLSTSIDNSVEFTVPAPDTTQPEVTINQAGTQADPTSSAPINFTVVFTEAVTGFDSSDVDLSLSTTGGTLVPTVTGGPVTYNVAVAGMTTAGEVIAFLPSNAAQDAATNDSAPSTSGDNIVDFTVPVSDTTNPEVTINQAGTQADPTSSTPINFTVAFSEDVTDFNDVLDVLFTGSTVGGTLMATITGGPATFNVAVTGMTTSGTIVASIPANAAQDAAANLSVASTSIDNTVSYTAPVADTPLTITMPANMTVPNDPGLAGAIVNYLPATASGGEAPIVVVCVAASGTFFALGTSTVTCTATDSELDGTSAELAAAAVATGTFTITVVDTEPPVIADGPDLSVTTNGTTAVVVFATPAASDNAGPPTVTCVPPSGTAFALGVTTVTCTATDGAGLTASSSFTVTVATRAQLPATGHSNHSLVIAMSLVLFGALLLLAAQINPFRPRSALRRRRTTSDQ